MQEKSYFLFDEDDHLRRFRQYNVTDKLKHSNVKINNGNMFNFHINGGDVYLKGLDQIYVLDLIQGKCDIVLPENPIPSNYVILMQNFNYLTNEFSSSKYQIIKIYGNKKRILGFDEPLICDIPFAMLKLVFVDEQNGWVIF